MHTKITDNAYARLLKEQGKYVITIEGVDWYDYSGFMIPAYLPHCCPEINEEIAKKALKVSGKPFVKWDERFGKVEKGQWWYVLKRNSWTVEEIKDKKKRWMVRQGKKRFHTRILTYEEVISKCPDVAQSAASRYIGKAQVETRHILEQRVQAAQKIPGVLEYIGCFDGDTLVSFSENYIQNNAVWLANIRHVPSFLKEYSSYGLMDGILDFYLNKKRMDYVLDGWRSIHHRTNFQEHLENVFNFSKEYAVLNVLYSSMFDIALNMVYPLRYIIWSVEKICTNSFLDNVSAVLRQENIRRSFQK